MATPLNTFKTVTTELTTSNQTLYTSPTGITSIVLMAQAANVSNNVTSVVFSHYDVSTTTETELVKNYEIPPFDASGLLTGKLVIETGDSLKASVSANNSIKLTLSILESVNA